MSHQQYVSTTHTGDHQAAICINASIGSMRSANDFDPVVEDIYDFCEKQGCLSRDEPSRRCRTWRRCHMHNKRETSS